MTDHSAETKAFQPPQPSGDPAHERSALKVVVKTLLPILILLLGAMVMKRLIASAEEPERRPRPNLGALIDVTTFERTSERLDVSAQGEVVPARSMVLQPQVSGLIEWHSEALTPGGFVAEGEPLIRLERREYRSMVSQARADLDQARAMVDMEEGRQHIAAREYDLFAGDLSGSGEGRSLALREPQRREVEARVDAAETRLSLARLSLDRTEIAAPFNGFVQDELVEVGQLVGPQSRLATLIGTDAFWVQASLPLDDLPRIAIPGVNANIGSTVRVTQAVGSETREWDGRVVRLLGDLDPLGRMARLLIQVDDPMGLNDDASGGGFPLLIGSFVQAEIAGLTTEDVIEIPRRLLHEGDRVYVMTDDDTLEIRQVTITWRREDTVLISAGLEPGERVVASHLGVPVDGMKLRLPGQEPPGPDSDTEPNAGDGSEDDSEAAALDESGSEGGEQE